MTRRVLVAAVCVLMLGGCRLQHLDAPSTPMTYGWVMAVEPHVWLVQVGPKLDADGLHVAVYWYRYDTGAEGFHEYPIDVDDHGDYGLVWLGDGWHAMYDGRTLEVVTAVGPPTRTMQYQTDTGERTTQ